MIKRILFLAILLVPLVQAATIQGTVYDVVLEPQQNVVIEIDTVPQQKVISKDGAYSLEVPIGTYTITASYSEDDVLIASAEESIEVKEDGTFNLDLILFPILDEDPIDNDLDISLDESLFRPEVAVPWLLLIILLAIIGVVYLRKKKKGKREDVLESDLEKVVRILKDKGKRATQKEIRKEMGLSEAKVSLMVADLESQGIVKKIKKGRGNIIVLVKKS